MLRHGFVFATLTISSLFATVSLCAAEVGSDIIVAGPGSCESCNVFDGARFCSASMMCYIPRFPPHGGSAKHHPDALTASKNTTPTPSNSTPDERDRVFQAVRDECARECGGVACGDLTTCFGVANASCGACVFIGGWWNPSLRQCFIGTPETHEVQRNCILQDGTTFCVRRDAQCPSCERFNKPIQCSPQLAGVIVSGVFAAAFAALFAWTCYRAEYRISHQHHSTDGSEHSDASHHERSGLMGRPQNSSGRLSKKSRQARSSKRFEASRESGPSTPSITTPNDRSGGINASVVLPPQGLQAYTPPLRATLRPAADDDSRPAAHEDGDSAAVASPLRIDGRPPSPPAPASGSETRLGHRAVSPSEAMRRRNANASTPRRMTALPPLPPKRADRDAGAVSPMVDMQLASDPRLQGAAGSAARLGQAPGDAIPVDPASRPGTSSSSGTATDPSAGDTEPHREPADSDSAVVGAGGPVAMPRKKNAAAA